MAGDGVEGASNGHDRNPSVAAEDHAPMTPGGRGPRAKVGQGPWALEVYRHVPSIASDRLRLGGRLYTPVPNTCNESGREEEEDVFTAAAMLSCGADGGAIATMTIARCSRWRRTTTA